MSHHTAHGSVDLTKQEQPTSKRPRPRRAKEAFTIPLANPIDEAMKPLTDEERRSWEGWAELESDPVSFSML
jgi:ubiquitin carboxyl-terminal hydrolase L5